MLELNYDRSLFGAAVDEVLVKMLRMTCNVNRPYVATFFSVNSRIVCQLFLRRCFDGFTVLNIEMI